MTDHQTIRTLLSNATEDSAPYPLRLVTVQAICNLFSSPLFPPTLVSEPLCSPVIELVTSALLDKDHTHLRAAASSLAFNLAVYVQKQRSTKSEEAMDDGNLVELAASFVETLKAEKENKDVVRALTLSLALIVYQCPLNSELVDMLKVLEAPSAVRETARKDGLGERMLAWEVAKLLEVKLV